MRTVYDLDKNKAETEQDYCRRRFQQLKQNRVRNYSYEIPKGKGAEIFGSFGLLFVMAAIFAFVIFVIGG